MNHLTRVSLMIFVFTLSSQAHAWTFTCGSQSISHQTLDRLTVTSAYGGFISLNMSINGQAMSVPTLLDDGTDTYESHDDDIELTVNPLVDEDGNVSMNLKVKSLKIKGTLTCNSVL